MPVSRPCQRPETPFRCRGSGSHVAFALHRPLPHPRDARPPEILVIHHGGGISTPASNPRAGRPRLHRRADELAAGADLSCVRTHGRTLGRASTTASSEWVDFYTQPRLQAAYGHAHDADYYYRLRTATLPHVKLPNLLGNWFASD